MTTPARDNPAARAALLACCLLLLAACGQKGDLYIPAPSAPEAEQTRDGDG